MPIGFSLPRGGGGDIHVYQWQSGTKTFLGIELNDLGIWGGKKFPDGLILVRKVLAESLLGLIKSVCNLGR